MHRHVRDNNIKVDLIEADRTEFCVHLAWEVGHRAESVENTRLCASSKDRLSVESCIVVNNLGWRSSEK